MNSFLEMDTKLETAKGKWQVSLEETRCGLLQIRADRWYA